MNKKDSNALYINSEDFNFLGGLSPFAKEKINEAKLQYSVLEEEQRDKVILEILTYLFSEDPVVAGKHRKRQWEDGWLENYTDYCKNRELSAIVPKYFDKYNIHRINGKFIKSLTPNFEIGLVRVFQYVIFDRYFRNAKNVYEFGAGTGHNLLRLREVNKDANLFSMEWAKSGVELINEVAKDLKDEKLRGCVFDNFDPDYSVSLNRQSSIYTFAALEQLGENTDSLIDFWVKNNVEKVINIEPMSEPLDENDLPQYLSIQYFKKRNYLKNYIQKLKDLEAKGKVRIHEVVRTGIGSMFIEGYSIISWSPIQD